MKMVISIGSNLNDPVSEVRSAIELIDQKFDLIAASSLYRSEPIGGPEQPEYINAVVVIDSNQPPKEVLQSLHEMEANAGRVRDVRWGPRTLDLDLIDVDGVVSSDPECLLPHPRAHERAFVLLPWLEADADAYLTGVGKVSDVAIANQRVERL